MNLRKNARMLGMICGGLALGAPAGLFASSASAFPLNPCPAIYYEEPFNTTHAVPQGCPPNAATQRLLQQQGQQVPRPATPAPGTPSPGATFPGTSEVTPPLPEAVRPAIASVTPTAGQISLQLVNETGTTVTYQAIGLTEQRVLRAGEAVTLRGLQVPLTVTMVRNDGGFIRAMPMAAAEAGTLSVSLNRTATLGENQRTLNVQPNGQVFAY
ncbi:hypothetical protein [Egbenema bharatensis]|uniref:hypothetical protein n=1 Tax=Egbenema bharatensis TaxID=3463334 RepID=UPI003A8C5B2E